MNTLKRIEARLSETAGPAVRTAKVLTKLAPLLVQNGFKVDTTHTTIGAKVPTAYVGAMSVKDTIALVMTLGLTKDKQQFSGHFNLSTPDKESVQVFYMHGMSCVTTQPAYVPMK